MKFLPLIWSGLWRKPGRTILILLQVAVAFALFGVLQGMKTGMAEAVAKVRADVLFVAPSAVGGTPLPLADLQQLQSIRGVKSVTYAGDFGGTYQKPTQPVGVFAIDTSDIWLTLVPDIFSVSPKDLEALRKTRTGALITADIGKKYGWHIGDRIALTSSTLQSNGSGTWFFDIVGTVTDHEPGEAGFIVTSYAYLDAARALDKGTVRNFYVIVSDPKQAASMADTIDRSFANSPSGTRTASLRENAEQAMQSIGDLNFAIRSIVSAVLVAIVFSTATMMMQTIRERAPELAVLKTVGFGNRAVFLFVATEALLVCIVASLLGLALAWIAFPLAGKYVPGLSMPVQVVALGVVGAVFVALLSVSLPGLRAARLNVIDALAGR
ncbi:MAG TPA: FtsX-like permease family protein [Steroidobacteraceae bacterium]|jgi:putative ABC transport system permease protein|nr:FtsX-like permease family protein [Steroidobacteraceae bacterium]